MITTEVMQQDRDKVLQFREYVQDFQKRFTECIQEVKWVDDIGSILEYSGDSGVLFTVDVMDDDKNYIFNFGDASYSVDDHAFQMIKELLDQRTAE